MDTPLCQILPFRIEIRNNIIFEYYDKKVKKKKIDFQKQFIFSVQVDEDHKALTGVDF